MLNGAVGERATRHVRADFTRVRLEGAAAFFGAHQMPRVSPNCKWESPRFNLLPEWSTAPQEWSDSLKSKRSTSQKATVLRTRSVGRTCWREKPLGARPCKITKANRHWKQPRFVPWVRNETSSMHSGCTRWKIIETCWNFQQRVPQHRSIISEKSCRCRAVRLSWRPPHASW